MSYSDTLETDLDKIRAWVGDTSNDPSTELMTDDHIEAVLSLYVPFNTAVTFLANELAVRFAQQPGSVTLPSGLSVSWSERVKTWQTIAQLARQGQLSGAGAFAVAGVRADGFAGAVTTDEFAR